MKIKKIICMNDDDNFTVNGDESLIKTIPSILPDIPQCLDLMKIAVNEHILIGVVYSDKYERHILVSPFGVRQIDYSYTAELVDGLDLGIAPCGAYIDVVRNETFDFMVYYEPVEAIVSGKNMIGYHLLDGTTFEFDVAVAVKDRELFDEEKTKSEVDIYIKRIDFNNNGKFD